MYVLFDDVAELGVGLASPARLLVNTAGKSPEAAEDATTELLGVLVGAPKMEPGVIGFPGGGGWAILMIGPLSV